ncbi:CaiB/BaiF CoA transferase family protein [Chloroflexota bacterium]
MSGCLQGIKVIECAQWIQGPVAGSMLGDLGAEVIKVENRDTGDPGRGLARVAGLTTGVAGRNYIAAYANRNKRSITLDLRKQQGQELLFHFVKECDVFIHNFRPGVDKNLKVDYDTLKQHNPKLIYAQATGFGEKGPVGLQPAFEYSAMARAGWLYLAGEPDTGPLLFKSGAGDHIGAAFLVQGILAALLARERLGIGQKVDVSLLGSLITIASLPVTCSLVLGQEYPRRSRYTMGNPLFNNYKCADDKWLVLNMQEDKYWPSFCKTMGIEHLKDDTKFSDMDVRSQNARELISTLDTLFSRRPRDEWLKILTCNGLIAGPIQTTEEMTTDPQVLENEYIMEYDHPVWGSTRCVGFPWKFSSTPAILSREEPEVGQHTEEILLEFGYNWNDIVELKEKEVI